MKKTLLIVLGLSLLCSAFVVRTYLNSDTPFLLPLAGKPISFKEALPKMRGVSWVAGDSVTEEQIANLKQNNIQWISQTPFGWQTAYNLPEIKINTQASRQYWGESDLGLIHTTHLSKKAGIKTLLKPHLWLRDRSGKWLGDIEMANEEQWQEWFKNYTAFIMHYAQLAEKEEIEALCIGTELLNPAVTHEKEWREIIKKVRKVYSGQLTYAANWYLEYEQIKFWDDLDFIGVQAYFPLTKNAEPTLKELKAGWQKHITQLENMNRRYKKPIVFTEAGYKNTKDAAIEPWAWPKRGEPVNANESAETQARCYQAMFETVWQKPWMGGMFIWKWYPRIRNARNLSDFTPQQKPAEKILAQWYGR